MKANTKKLRARFKHTKFGAYLPIVPVAAAPKGSEEAGKIAEEEKKEGEEDVAATTPFFFSA